MTLCLHLLTAHRQLPNPVFVGLPSGTLKSVALSGNVHIYPDPVMQEVLYVPEFKSNLLYCW